MIRRRQFLARVSAAAAALTVLMVLPALSTTAGCGGGDSGDDDTSPFAGSWLGTWEDEATGEAGLVDMDIASDGSVSGGVFNATSIAEGDLTGSIERDGAFTFTLDYPDVSYATSGTLRRDAAGHLTGTAQYSLGGAPTGTIAFDLAPVGSGTVSVQ